MPRVKVHLPMLSYVLRVTTIKRGKCRLCDRRGSILDCTLEPTKVNPNGEVTDHLEYCVDCYNNSLKKELTFKTMRDAQLYMKRFMEKIKDKYPIP